MAVWNPEKKEQMDHYPVISGFFRCHLEIASLSVDTIAEVVSIVAEQAAETILADHKLFSIGLGPDCASALSLARLMQHGILRERPSLPIIELTEQRATIGEQATSWVSEQLKALGQPGDLGIVFAASLNETEIKRLTNAATQRQVKLVWFAAQGPGLNLFFPDIDLEHRLVMNNLTSICLAKLIDICTFGPLEE